MVIIRRLQTLLPLQLSPIISQEPGHKLTRTPTTLTTCFIPSNKKKLRIITAKYEEDEEDLHPFPPFSQTVVATFLLERIKIMRKNTTLLPQVPLMFSFTRVYLDERKKKGKKIKLKNWR